MGTIVFLRAAIVPHAPAWKCLGCRSASQMRAAPYIHKSCGSELAREEAGTDSRKWGARCTVFMSTADRRANTARA
ncbi:hypothetical protein CXB41_05555 [Pseudomonas syringae pv. syringae]|nr:hypothetical protein CXB41_05555 [Pseudomonas syringae pv. syringae]